MKAHIDYKKLEELAYLTLKILESNKDPLEMNDYTVEIQFLCYLMDGLVTKVLQNQEASHLSKRKQYEILRKKYESLKVGVQEAIAVGFTEALRNFTKMDIEYVCHIKALPDSKNITTH